jgi:hypothetical protein
VQERVSYRQDPDDPQSVIKDFSGIVLAGPVEPRPDRPKRMTRDFRHPQDLGLFFHPRCTPRVILAGKARDEIAQLLAEILVADYRKRSKRWARIRDVGAIERGGPRCQAHVASVEGRRVFTMTHPEWERLRAQEGKLVEIDLERTPAGSLEQAASVIALLAAECCVHTERIEVWPYHAAESPTALNVQSYFVLESLTRRLNVPMFAERASTKDSPTLRKCLREHVFVVTEQPDKGRWEPKGLDRIVFMAV